MKNLNHKQEKLHLNREKLKDYLDKQVVPEGLDDFEREAVEGWVKTSSSLSILKTLDRKYKRFYLKVSGISLLAAALITFVLFFLMDSEQKPVEPSQDKQQLVERPDVEISEEIAGLKMIPDKKIIHPKEITTNFRLKKSEEETVSATENKENEKAELYSLPIIEPEPEVKPEGRPVRKSFHAKEIYIRDLKLVDYREYRSRPAIKTEQIILTGTSADKENGSSKENETDWKQVDIPYYDYIQKTIEVFSKGNFKKALSRFEEILKTYPDDLNANFYGGLCYYNLGNYQKATSSFEICTYHEYNNFTEEAEWYLAKSLRAGGETEKAKMLFKRIHEANGFYAAQAKKEI